KALSDDAATRISISVLVGLYTEKMDMHMRLIVNDPDSILNSLTREIKAVDPDGKEVTTIRTAHYLVVEGILFVFNLSIAHYTSD
ncbi:hypothetical protein IFM89_024251, partial [Coptis chinensis]